MRKLLLLLPLIWGLLAGRTFAQEIDPGMNKTAYRVMGLVKDKQYAALIGKFPEALQAGIPAEALKPHVDRGADFIREFGLPTAVQIAAKTNPVPTESGVKEVQVLIFPFPGTDDPDIENLPPRTIEVGFLAEYGTDKIVSFYVSDPVMLMQEQKDREFMDSLRQNQGR